MSCSIANILCTLFPHCQWKADARERALEVAANSMPPPLPGTENTETVVRQAQEEEAAARAQRQAQEEEAATARAQRQAQEEEAENARRAAEEQASANKAEEREAARERRAKEERELEEAERRAFNEKVAQDEANDNSKTHTDKEEAYQNLHSCNVLEGYCEIEFKKYTNNGDPRFKDRACAKCKNDISTPSAYACKNFWMAEVSDPSMCQRPFLCCSCFEAENANTTGRRKRRKRSLD